MAIKTIDGTLTIPTTEPSTSGIYDDLSVKLYFLSGNTESLQQSSAVTTSNTFEFTYNDEGQQIRVKLVRVSSGVVLSESKARGVLPRSFLKDVPEPSNSFDNKNWLFDAGLAVIASAGGKHFPLAYEITQGIIESQISGGTVPFSANHIFPQTDVNLSAKTGTVALVAYSLGFYLEKNPLASNKVEVANTIYDLLGWLLGRKNTSSYGGLFLASATDTFASTIDNVLVYFAFKQAGRILNPALYNVSTALASSINSQLFDSANGKFKYSLVAGGSYNVTDNLELNLFGSLFLIEEDKIIEAEVIVDRIETSYSGVDVINNVNGYKAKAADIKLWYEGSYGVSVLYSKLGDSNKYSEIKRSLNTLLNEDGSFRYGVIKDGQLNVLDYKSVGSTAWGYMANKFPADAFSVGTGSPLAGLPVYYFNNEISSGFTRNDCGVGETGTTVTYTVPAGSHLSTISQIDADDKAQDDIDANGQNYANSYGSCNIPYTYFNTLRTGYFQKAGCEIQESGTTYTYTVPAHSFGSTISQGHAEALADAKLLIDGQAYANSNGTCTLVQQYILFKPIKTVVNNMSNDDIYLSYSAASAPNTGVTISGRYRLDGISSYQPTDLHYMNAGSVVTTPTYIGSVAAGGSPSVQIQITGLTPSNFGYQHYVWLEAVDPFGNEQQSAYFIKSCAGNNINANSILEYVVSADTYSANLDTHQANVLAWKDIALNGQAWVDNNPAATCGAAFYNTYQSSAFTKSDCGFPYTGSTVIYEVAAGTYSSTVSVAVANAIALSEIALNGQAYANTHGECLLPANYKRIQLRPRVDYFGMYDNVYGIPRIVGLGTANTDITVAYNLYNDVTGTITYSAGTVTLYNGDNHSPEQFLIQVPPHHGDRIRPIITSLTPSSFGGINYIF